MTAPKRALDAPTQVQHPWRATLRTGLAVLLGILVTIPLVWAIIGDELAAVGWAVPEPWAAIIAAIVTGCVVAASAITRIMAIPAVSDVLTRLHLGPEPLTVPGEVVPGAGTPPAELVPAAEHVTDRDVTRLTDWHDQHNGKP